MKRVHAARGFSLMEVLIAGIVLTAALIPILGNFHSLYRGFRKTHEASHATFLAQAILENVRYRLYDGDLRWFRYDEFTAGVAVPDGDPRYAKLNDDSDTRRENACNGGHESFFLKLAEEGEPIVVRAGEKTSQYFVEFLSLKDSKLHGITAETNPRLHAELDTYRVTLEVRLSAPTSRIDSDGDGNAELDMAELGATVRWVDRAKKEQVRQFWTMLTRHQYNTYPQGPRPCP